MPEKGERRRLQIINTAKEMFIEQGFQSTHIGQICDKLDIARGTVYQYFSNKKEIIFALVDSVAENVKEILDKKSILGFIETSANEDIRNVIRQRITASIEAVLSEPIIIKLLYKDIPGIETEIIAHVDKVLDAVKHVIADEVQMLKEHGFFRQNIDPFITASFLLGGIIHLVYEYDKEKKDVLNHDVLDALVLNYLRGVLVA